ncbi:MAG TPA: helix-turn-helix transcriptional regulator [Candidatus Limnocylindrales bacterium]|nr:helix-turn-helix transcriptional regulator [Candidatus Limnocylindrales bacterium]
MAATAGQEIRAERRRRQWSLAKLAARAGLSDAHLAQIEAGAPASLESYARLMTALDLVPELHGSERQRGAANHRPTTDIVHAAMGEIEAARLSGFGFKVAIDEPYQHYQFAGRADLAAWDVGARALLHIENRTQFPNVQESLGAYASKRVYLGRVLADRLGVRPGWRSQTHVIAALWSSEVLHVVRKHEATFAAACAEGIEPMRAWWEGRIPAAAGVTSSLVLLDPAPGVRAPYRLGAITPATRPRYPGYAAAADALRGR